MKARLVDDEDLLVGDIKLYPITAESGLCGAGKHAKVPTMEELSAAGVAAIEPKPKFDSHSFGYSVTVPPEYAFVTFVVTGAPESKHIEVSVTQLMRNVTNGVPTKCLPLTRKNIVSVKVVDNSPTVGGDGDVPLKPRSLQYGFTVHSSGSNNAWLEGIRIEPTTYSLSPAFDKDHFEYEVVPHLPPHVDELALTLEGSKDYTNIYMHPPPPKIKEPFTSNETSSIFCNRFGENKFRIEVLPHQLNKFYVLKVVRKNYENATCEGGCGDHGRCIVDTAEGAKHPKRCLCEDQWEGEKCDSSAFTSRKPRPRNGVGSRQVPGWVWVGMAALVGVIVLERLYSRLKDGIRSNNADRAGFEMVPTHPDFDDESDSANEFDLDDLDFDDEEELDF